jgi:hypothetical protein
LEVRNVYYDLQKSYKPSWIKEIRDLIVAKKEVSLGKSPEMQKKKFEDYLGQLEEKRDLFWPPRAKRPDRFLIRTVLGIPDQMALALCRAWARNEEGHVE